MTSVRIWALIVVAAGGLLAPRMVSADETTYCTAYIETLPYTITTQGHYCFNKNLSTAMSSGTAILILADFVVVDLNGFKLGGGAAGLGTQATGIGSGMPSNVTVRNGVIRGFQIGIDLGLGSNYLIENNLLDSNTLRGIRVGGSGLVVVRNNLVTNTGGGNGLNHGIMAFGDLATVVDNTVVNAFSTTGYAVGIAATHGVMDHNVVQMPLGPFLRYGIRSYVFGVCRDNTVLDASPGRAFEACTLIGDDNYSNP